MKTVEQIKLEAYNSSQSLSKTLQAYNLTLDDVGVYFLNDNINWEDVDTRIYPIGIFYSISKDEVKQFKIDFTNDKIKEAVRLKKVGVFSIAS